MPGTSTKQSASARVSVGESAPIYGIHLRLWNRPRSMELVPIQGIFPY
jgi:hypothetical protein